MEHATEENNEERHQSSNSSDRLTAYQCTFQKQVGPSNVSNDLLGREVDAEESIHHDPHAPGNHDNSKKIVSSQVLLSD